MWGRGVGAVPPWPCPTVRPRGLARACPGASFAPIRCQCQVSLLPDLSSLCCSTDRLLDHGSGSDTDVASCLIDCHDLPRSNRKIAAVPPCSVLLSALEGLLVLALSLPWLLPSAGPTTLIVHSAVALLLLCCCCFPRRSRKQPLPSSAPLMLLSDLPPRAFPSLPLLKP